jgi:asparagine synthase (glutamine-hydrolysing)
MCGICGVVQLGGDPREVVPPWVLDEMTDSMTHRGPDDRGTYAAAGVALGVRRLSIVDVEGGHQPFSSESGAVVAIQNGELYNHDALRKELAGSGHAFRTHCDTEVLPHLYEQHGEGFAERLHGKFGVAVWDERKRRAVLARDRLGVKPLYWAQSGDVVVFASELKSVLASGLIDPMIDAEAIDLFMTFGYVPGPRTPIAGVRKLQPGSILTIDAAGAREQPYWLYPAPGPSEPVRSLDDYADELSDLLRTAVTDRLMSDVPLGAMLSGGLDSSLIVAMMSDEMGEPVETFSIGFREDQNNELADARRVAELFGCRHHEVELSVATDVLELDELVRHMDEPVADLSALGFDVLSRVASEHVTVALSGQGADELFGGYTKHRVASALQTLVWLPDVARRVLADVPWPNKKLRRAARALAATDPSMRLLAMSGWLDEAQRATLYSGVLADVPPVTAYNAVREIQGELDGHVLSSLLHLDARLALVDDMLLYFDRMSMAHSLEVRVPFLDHRLVEWAATIPPTAKVRRGATKRVLKRVGTRVLPEATVTKRKVGFFRSALDAWLLAQLEREGGERLRSPDARYRDYLDGTAVDALVTEYVRRPDGELGRPIFAVLLLDAWLGVVGRTAPPSNARAARIGNPGVG